MPTYFRLQDLTSVSTSTTQRIDEAVDIGAQKTIVAQVRKPVAAVGVTTARLYLQHAAVLEEDSFVRAGGANDYFDLASTTSQVLVYQDLLRFTRWESEFVGGALTTPPQFLVDCVGRES